MKKKDFDSFDQLDDYFIKDKKESTKYLFEIYDLLSQKVDKYIDPSMPIIKGKKIKYNDILKNKKMPEDQQNINKVFDDFSKLFKRAVIWENAGTMINITPPVNIVSLIAAFYTAQYNPNFAQDESSGYLMTTELLVAKYLSDLVDWDYKKSGGIFTFGGKGTNLYAVKVGLKKIFPNITDEGIADRKIVVISNEKSHPCHREVCDWLGLGKNSCIRLPVDRIGQLDVFKLELCLRNYIEANIKIGCIILNGGTTNEIIIDPIKEVVDLRDKLVKEYNLDYIPHIHVDSVIGFAWLFFKKYDFSKNKFNMNSDELKKIKSMKNKISQLKYADSFGADFHKTGFCPYISSIFMAKNYDDITSLGNKKNNGIENMKFGEYSPFEYTLELTRSSIGPVSAYVALETFGVEGFQRLIYKLFSNGEYIRDRLNNLNDFEVINMDTEGIATLFIIRKNDDNRKYSDIINEPSDEIIEFVDYNHQFYLFSLKNFEKNKINFKMTFSKSYKPYGCSHQTGCLKLYPTSPLTTKKDIDKIINQMYELKKQYDNSNERLIEDIDAPIDYVFR